MTDTLEETKRNLYTVGQFDPAGPLEVGTPDCSFLDINLKLD